MRTTSQAGLSSFSAFIVAVVTLLGITGVAFAGGGAMFTPGSLNAVPGAPMGGITSHSEIQQCGTCHAAPWDTDTMADRCLACHADITAQLQDPTSLHSIVRFGETDLNCRTCHTEHHGPTASLTRIPPGWDPHEQLGFSLKSHRLRMDGTPFECKDCHINGYSGPFDQAICADCHLKVDQVFAQEHFLTFGTDCQACHDGIDTHGSNFDHNEVPFHLVGIHALTACSECHVNARNLADLQATAQDCYSCHAKDDQHEGRFGTKCGVCHTPEGWGKSAQFDHDLASFKLRGLHLKVACADCHKNNVYKGIPSDCFSCHEQDDKHNGEFGPQCELCHVAEGWNRAVDHSKFAFKLDGKHTTVACEACHIDALFIGTPMDCASCHKKDDAHAGRFGDQCGDCHTTENWTSATFDHNSVSFKLNAHQTKSDGTAFVCKDCHVKNYASPFDQNICANCHLRDNQAFAAEHILTFWTNCMACHDGIDSHGSNFNHNRVPFNLVGKHALTACSKCHLNDRTIADMQATPQQCYTCHQKDDFHNGQFGQDCAACHAPDGWKPAHVDHSKFAFHLDGQHATVACENCHKNGIFKGTPMDCASCHIDDDAHGGTLGTQCESCHTPDGWKPAHVDHSKFAFKLDGKHATAACTDCHKNNVFKGTPMDCAACHIDDDAHAGSLGTQCGTCHNPNGWSPATFDHNTASFKLTAHQTKSDGTAFVCKDCHLNGYASPFDQNSCGNCHLQMDMAFSTEHFLTFGTDCMACHDGVDSHGSIFDHNKVPFNLIGKHAPLACSKCHINARKLADLQAAPQACFSCHEKDDHHNGQFGTDCAACHTPEGWENAKVDHSLFAFHLDGKHSTVACEKCHINGVFKGIPQDCGSCHTKDDAHQGQLGTQCGTCHTPDGWKPAKVDHSKFAFHLDGKHSAVACANCHKDNLFKGTPMDCASCHLKDDAHSGKLGTECAACHSPEGWKPAKVDHSKFAFKLDGQHATAACTDCHKDNLFKGTPMDCAACHLKDDAHAGTLGTQCGTCHSPSGWSPATFDHDAVSFKLTAHKTKSNGTPFVCKDCHVFGYAAPFHQEACGNCHLQFDQIFSTDHFLTFGTDCMACHDGVESHGSNFDHNKVPFNLIGKHAPLVCSKCHVGARKFSDLQNTPQACFSCHQKDDHHNGQFGTDCAACHSPEGWENAKVDHSKFAFHLDGKHATVACENCHINGVFKGTPQDCASCHTKDDAHNGQLGTQCASCHSPEGWKPANVDHSKFAFHLDGQHATVACESCHINGVFKGTPQDCASCHASDDAHNGTYGSQCATCHTPTDWKQVTFDHNTTRFTLKAHKDNVCEDCHQGGFVSPFDQNTCGNCHLQIDKPFATEHFITFGTNCIACHDGEDSHGSSFDHNLVPFNLIGKHAPVACSKCHIASRNLHDLKATSQECISCHVQDDHHNGQFGNDCAACHSPEGWELATVDHSLFAFHLDGQHATVACENCHVNGVFKGTPMDCASCHSDTDPHGGSLGPQCETCHTPNGWKPSSFDHNNSIFKLTGRHNTVVCSNCHIDLKFKGTPTNCASCHSKNDPHAGKLGTDCASCHTTNGWTPSTFDHSRSTFALDGKHTSVACSQCHTDKLFKGTPSDCASCHSDTDPHGGALGNQCTDCHTTSGWKPSSFNHNNSIFKLTGQHSNVACSNCHKDMKFKGTPTNCFSCHEQDDNHNGTLGTNCAACHSTAAWKPSTFDHSNSAFPLTGKHTSAACAKCHVNNVFKGTPTNCFACHAQDDNHNGTFGQNCAACHSTSGWKPSTFDHSKSAFPLTGKHTSTTCTKCHVNNVFKGTPTNCYACHASNDRHGGKYGTNCAACHSTSAWRPATFDHTFPLDHGESGTVACATCHPGGNTSSYTCFGCHEHTSTNMADKHKEERDYAPNKCADCHPDGSD